VKGRRRAVVALVLFLGLALVSWREPAPGPTGGWMARAGVAPRFETVDGVRLRYVRAGAGPPVVLMHGFAASIVTWKDVLPVLARDHDVVAVDFPGFGGSEIRPDLPPSAYPRLVTGLMDRLGLPRASLAGNSLGGAVAIVVAATQPDRVDRLVLIDSVGFNLASADRPWLLRVVGFRPMGRVAEALPVRRAMVRLALHQVLHDDRLATPERVDEYVAPLLRPGAITAAQAVLASGDTLGLPGLISQVRAPTLVIWGREDKWVPVAHADRFLAAIPGSRKVVIDGCGHIPQEERPQQVAALLEEFLPAR